MLLEPSVNFERDLVDALVHNVVLPRCILAIDDSCQASPSSRAAVATSERSAAGLNTEHISFFAY